ncbi:MULTISPECIES: gamma carbonic anhydrase family protein [Rhodococcus]|uniref:Gamma carbonic anhydrase family protein n=1 Tax=Rhodococcus oxybenzonivorans TaxID=1990687 RepID=A0A2S2BXB9_9NOCA|nr:MULTISPECIES: gamma carbonic anhydrase family protein [Rhodococcus]AWK73209.1 gamma carbonic anhydrase family protein [Rhodococcus oxybenzonivorans]MDV7244784.1 gamma carbonic anhydrase family protein [Rhodococcus oxybenzonivorans]MDV7263583.1 gamma carbonic anhydrase family protein [Rhodococcus oxybenzonivorans]MDV7275717.1 gamma carbonic anhydrase family protein [Rhodococcus oxybenzonivorans]MDV7332494.1 gamma carbonic anhydrase family protein [Rhodococcus oxybenzonivorans]
MAIYALGEQEPDISPDAYVHPDAVVIGNVTLAAGASVWPQAVLRADYGTISIGAGTNIQDGTVIHCTPIDPTVIGSGCVVGHAAHIEGSTIGDNCLIASGSVVLNGSVIGAGSVVGAGAVIPFKFEVPPRRMALGVPAKIREGYEVPEGHVEMNVKMYSANAAYYRDALRRLD